MSSFAFTTVFKRLIPLISSDASPKRFQIIFIFICCLTLFVTFYVYFDTNSNYFSVHNTQSVEVKTNSDKKSVRICCLIITCPDTILTRARAVHETWAPRCDRHFFVSENFTNNNITAEQAQIIKQLPFLPIGNISSGRQYLTHKVNTAFLVAYQHYLNDFDWFVKSDDDTYILVENLRAFLAKQNATEPVTFGYNFKVTHIERYQTN